MNVRRIRNEFLSKFLTTYSLRPIGEVGSVFRQYPHPWKVFVEDKSTPGRYLLAANCESRPAGEGLLSRVAIYKHACAGKSADTCLGRGASAKHAQAWSSLLLIVRCLVVPMLEQNIALLCMHWQGRILS